MFVFTNANTPDSLKGMTGVECDSYMFTMLNFCKTRRRPYKEDVGIADIVLDGWSRDLDKGQCLAEVHLMGYIQCDMAHITASHEQHFTEMREHFLSTVTTVERV